LGRTRLGQIITGAGLGPAADLILTDVVCIRTGVRIVVIVGSGGGSLIFVIVGAVMTSVRSADTDGVTE